MRIHRFFHRRLYALTDLLLCGMSAARPLQAQTADEVQALGQQLTTLQSQVQTLQAQLGQVQQSLAQAAAVTTCIQGSTTTSVIFSGCSVSIRNGNLILGYNENKSPALPRSGSHNLVIGPFHSYTSKGGLVAGYQNTVAGAYATVSGGRYNVANSLEAATVSGGAHNTASNRAAAVSGGSENDAGGLYSVVSAGRNNSAGIFFGSVSGGQQNIASGSGAGSGGRFANTVSGGASNTASGIASSISGGQGNGAGSNSCISAGEAFYGRYTSVSGGQIMALREEGRP